MQKVLKMLHSVKIYLSLGFGRMTNHTYGFDMGAADNFSPWSFETSVFEMKFHPHGNGSYYHLMQTQSDIYALILAFVVSLFFVFFYFVNIECK